MRLATLLATMLLAAAPCSGQGDGRAPTVPKPIGSWRSPQTLHALSTSKSALAATAASIPTTPITAAPVTATPVTATPITAAPITAAPMTATPATATADTAAAAASGPPTPGDGGSPPVPEPSTLLLVGTGLVGVALVAQGRRRRRSA